MSAVPAPFALLGLIQGAMLSQALYAAASLGIADVLADGPRPATDIAKQVDADPDATYRLLRVLASYGIFAEGTGQRFELTPMADALRTDAPMSMRRIALLMGHPTHWEDWGHFLEAVRTGEPSLPKVRGMSAWDFFTAEPEYAAVFFGGMGNLSDLENEPVAAAVDYSRFARIVDVGGGRGNLLAAILRRAPGSSGVVFAPPTVEEAEQVLTEAGVADRCTAEAGSFLETIPAGGDAYLLKHIVHDWPEEQAVDILRNVRKAIKPDGKLLLMENVVPEGNTPHSSKLIDLWLLLLVGGRERTEAEYDRLLTAAGFALSTITETAAGLSVIEADPV
uniref:Putative O-methyltransferase n=1 Tax=uncultured bacterium BAC AB649/1850 TaxID=1037453 RepID=F6K0X7_9BACT|nr:putative O-methyltransferase [uncultured bacterium BAC AB649/1850]